ncbi:serine/threonine-protein kinase [Sphaerisporangium aureirubrum]|uniref:Serine/threonine-protein kinase n=1 Tax=Sphaerisporangium aureirubrum TaxID=1544736 RepID=A0ABW1NLC8_9ACTN
MNGDGTVTSARTIGPYTLVRRLGEGGMGVVYLAKDPAGRRVAVKVIRPERAQQEEFRLRFEKEAVAARRVARFCTAPVLDSGMDNGVAYLVTEYVDGPDLSAVVEAQGPLAGGNLEALAVGVATALVAIHQAEVVHRDLKPSNILLSPLGGPRVIDFGIAQLADTLGTQSLIGTPAYMSPEHADSRVTAASDVFAWGGVITYAATGSPPFGTGGAMELLYRILNSEPRLDGMDERLRPLVERALEKDPARRLTAQQLLDRLLGREKATIQAATEAVGDIWTPVDDAGATLAAQALRRRRRRSWLPAVTALTAAVVTAVVLLVVFLPGGPVQRLMGGGALAQRDVARNGYHLDVRLLSLRRVGKTVTLEWSVKFVSTAGGSAKWEPGSAFGRVLNYGMTRDTAGVVLIDPAAGGRYATAEKGDDCLCSDLAGKVWMSGETAPFYNTFGDVSPDADLANVDIPGIGLFPGVPVESR